MEDQARFRRHKGACPYYRENWVNSGDLLDREARDLTLYEIYCLKDTPPLTAQEQQRCMRSAHICWRLKPRNAAKGARAAGAGAANAAP